MKIARYATGKPAIITFENAFHGRTLMTMTMTAKLSYKHHFGPFAPEIYRAPFPYPFRMNMTPQQASAFCITEIERMIVNKSAQTRWRASLSSRFKAKADFFLPLLVSCANSRRSVRDWLLIIADEIQSGFFRIGRMFAVEHDGVEPDLMIIAESMGAGMPISGVVGRADIMDAPAPGTLGGT